MNPTCMYQSTYRTRKENKKKAHPYLTVDSRVQVACDSGSEAR